MRGWALRFSLALIVACGLGAPLTAPTKVYRIGYLSGLAPSSVQYDLLRQALRERGSTEGENVVLEPRSADGYPERLPGLAARAGRAEA